jgi:hypothetical protein
VSDEEKQIRELFRAAAIKEGKSLRQWCKDNGIVYETLIGREIPSVVPLSSVHDHKGMYSDSCPVCSTR